MMVWGFVRLLTRTGSLLATSAISMLVVGTLLFGWWLTAEVGVGGHSLEAIQKQSFMGRFENSAEGREQIWARLVERYQKTPLGIGPGNSSEQRLSVGSRERRGSHRSKEAHNDYLGYLVERGPLGLLGLALLVVLPFVAVWRGFRKVADRAWRRGPGGALAAALAGGLVATTVHSLTMEKLHFRHYWMFLGIVYAFAAATAPRLAMAVVKRRHHRSSRKRVSRVPLHAEAGRGLRPRPESA
jgi:O-antigen ligase